MVRTEYAKQNPDVIAAFLTDYQKSVKAANEDIDGTAALCEEVGVVAKAAIAKKALPKCNIVYRNGQEMKKDISAYLQVLYDASPPPWAASCRTITSTTPSRPSCARSWRLSATLQSKL